MSLSHFSGSRRAPCCETAISERCRWNRQKTPNGEASRITFLGGPDCVCLFVLRAPGRRYSSAWRRGAKQRSRQRKQRTGYKRAISFARSERRKRESRKSVDPQL